MPGKIMVFIFTAVFTFSISSNGQSKDELAIRKIMSDQVTAWNSRNLDNFMQGYWQSDSLKFVGKSGITYGWRQTLENYKSRYPDSAAMGKLAFELLEVKPLGDWYFFVIGRWALTRSTGNLNGYFTLLFKRIKGNWFIVTDHSS